jgi:hypothetical protein
MSDPPRQCPGFWLGVYTAWALLPTRCRAQFGIGTPRAFLMDGFGPKCDTTRCCLSETTGIAIWGTLNADAS